MNAEDDNYKLTGIIGEFLTKYKLQEGMNTVDVRNAWRHVMGSAIDKYTSKVDLRKQVLYVNLNSAVLRTELGYGKQKIVDNLNTYLKRDLIVKVIFT